jgi:DNA-binding GntR family transcriptional regulator
MNKKEPEKSAAEMTYRAIKDNILSQIYPPNFQLREIPLSKELGTTRTPVREAIIRLESEGLVSIYPRRGAFVNQLTTEEVENLFDVREAIETKAAELAIRKANRDELDELRDGLISHGRLIGDTRNSDYHLPALDFHESLIKLSHNQPLIDIWQGMRSKLQLARVTSAMVAQRYKEAHEEHQQILALIYAGKPDKVRKLLIEHIGKACRTYLKAEKIHQSEGEPDGKESVGRIRHRTGSAGI